MVNTNAKDFVNKWSDRGNEKQDTQQYWNDIIYDVLGAPKSTIIQYEKPVTVNGKQKYIDAYLPETRTLIEQKSLGIDLMKAESQSDGVKLTPYEQGRRYGGYLPYDEQPRWIIDCNFEEIRVHDMKKPADPPEIIKLKDMGKDYTRLMFLVNTEDEHLKKEFEVSVKAGEIVGVLYDKLLAQYKNPSEHDLQSLNRVCVRIVFCLYAEDAGLFGDNTNAFHDYLSQFNGPAKFRNGLKDLFGVLNQPYDERDPYLDPELASFPYVNGGLFKDDNIALPFFTDEIVDLILEKSSIGFDWSDISPTIFGAIFESTLNPETRRKGGMHYTSIENIHRVIDPLFLNDLKEELEIIKIEPIDKTRNKKLKDYQNKIASLRFLDPACGSGNFLTESYLCLRRLENEVIGMLKRGQIMMAFNEIPNPIKVSIGQFYGIEINDFACATAQTAMWIAEAKMMKETEAIVKQDFEFFPLTNNANIIEENALRIDWNCVIPSHELNYIMGNPPFVGTKYQSKEQKQDILNLCKGLKAIDYVSGWYYKAAEMMKGTNIHAALVSTNSITQGEQVAPLWENVDAKIDFAYRTFRWDSEASIKAHVHCVIIGFSSKTSPSKDKLIYDNGVKKIASNINGYLLDAPNVTISKRKSPLCDAPKMIKGSQPTDGGNFLLTKEEAESIVAEYPEIEPYVHPYLGADDLLNNRNRYCLWLKDCPSSTIRKMPKIMARIDGVRQSRLSSKKADTRKWADYPTLFTEDRQPDKDYLIAPVVSSEKRKYIPMKFVDKSAIANANAQMIPDADNYTFGILASNVHNAWTRTVCGRLELRYAYSATIVYNNFPWPMPTAIQKKNIEDTAKAILDARDLEIKKAIEKGDKIPSLADMYDELSMPLELRKAHQANDRAVMQAYGFSLKMTEQECVAELMKMYQKLTEQ